MSKILIATIAAAWAMCLPVHAELKVHVIDVGQAASALIELDHAAILIDAGGEDTGDDRDAKSIRDALTAFFARRTDLHNTLEAVIISHPHIDHTKNLMVVMQDFTVKQLVENGDQKTQSGIAQVKAARTFATNHQIKITKVTDSKILAAGTPLKLSTGALSSEKITLLSGYRNCSNANNDSIAVRIQDGNATALFAGDAEDVDDSKCKSEPQLQHLLKRFGSNGLLKARFYQATHHGSANGVLAGEIQKVLPAATVISAGRLDPANRQPGGFHAFQFGHPRKEAIDSLVANTSGSRPATTISFMTEDGGNHPSDVPATMSMVKAVYCTCWDGNIDVTFASNGTPSVEPLGAAHSSGGTGTAGTGGTGGATGTGTAGAQCNISSADVFTPTVKPPDSVKKAPADYFMLSLSWSPQFCTTSAGKSAANKFQCQENSFGIVVHGLWAQTAGVTSGNNQPRNCKTTTAIDTSILRPHLCTVPGVQLMQDEWAKHGTCAFDKPEDFLNEIESLMGTLKIPDLKALAKSKGTSLQAHDVIGAMTAANPGLDAKDVQLLLTGKSLAEIHVCYDLNFKFRKCDTSTSVADNTKVTILAPKP